MENKIQEAVDLLEALHVKQTRYSSKQPVEQLISTVLSQRTTYADECSAFQTMWKRYGFWSNIMVAPDEALANAISSSNYAEIKHAVT